MWDFVSAMSSISAIGDKLQLQLPMLVRVHRQGHAAVIHRTVFPSVQHASPFPANLA